MEMAKIQAALGRGGEVIIYKYPLEIVNKWFELPIPSSSQILTIQSQNRISSHKTFIWAIPGEECSFKGSGRKRLIAVGTGIDFSDVGMDGSERYIGTAQNDGCVWHLFEENFISPLFIKKGF